KLTTQSSKETKGKFSHVVSEAFFLQIEQEQLELLQRGERDITLTIPVGEKHTFQLELTRVDFINEQFKIETTKDSDFTYTSGIFYRGIIKGDTYSFATISIFKDRIRGLIGDNGGNYILGQLGNEKNTYALYNDKHLRIENRTECSYVDDDYSEQIKQSVGEAAQQQSRMGQCVGVYIVCDFDMFNHFGGITQVANYVFELFHEVAALYFLEGIDVEILELFVYDSPDPWVNTINSNCSVCCLKNTFANDLGTFPGAVAHLLTGDNISYPGGCADRPTTSTDLCNDVYAVSRGMRRQLFDFFPTFSREVKLFAHEMGHQLGSRHTHACAWNADNSQIDDCGNITGSTNDGIDGGCFDPVFDTPILPTAGGTIMSYCDDDRPGSGNIANWSGINFNLAFGIQPGNIISDFVANASCLLGDCDCTFFVNRNLVSISPASNIYEASNNITASGTASRPPEEPIVFRAGNRIELSNFTVTSSTNFIAEVSDTICDYNPPYGNIVDNDNAVENRRLTKHYFKVSPVPFKDQITLDWAIPTAEFVQLDLFNLSGQLVRTIIANHMMEEGYYQQSFDFKDLPDGIYYMRWNTQHFVKTLKVIKTN
ncbi:MAG: M12 family metallo-peptidase, partial [Bacteroidota bacterium]